MRRVTSPPRKSRKRSPAPVTGKRSRASAAVRPAAGAELDLQRVGHAADAGGPGDRLGPGQDVDAGGGAQVALRSEGSTVRISREGPWGWGRIFRS